MSIFILKLIACISMLLDHAGYAFNESNIILGCIGRIAFPIFSFCISEGYRHTKNIKRYLLRLFILAIISQIPFGLVYSIDEIYINTVATLLLGLIAICIYDKNKIIGVICTIFLGIIAQLLHFDYGLYGVILILVFYIFKDKKLLLLLLFLILTTGKYLSYLYEFISYGNNIIIMIIKYYLPYYLSTLPSIIFILLYNGKQGKNLKWLFYIFYPLHLSIIALVKYIILN